MSSIASLVATHGLIRRGQGTLHDPDMAVMAAQVAISAAGYRVGQDGVFGPGTESAVKRLQAQHNLSGSDLDGVIGPRTAKLLDLPHTELIQLAKPVVITAPRTAIQMPHDDTASLIAFYGKPWVDATLLSRLPLPFKMTYEEGGGKPVQTVHTISFHRRVIDQLEAALDQVWDVYGHDQQALDLTRFTKFSGTFNYRAIRGSSRLSCHAFGAAIDVDAEDLPLGHPNPENGMPQNIVDAFKAQGFFWGNDYHGRKDPMHFQAAHE